MKSQTQGQSLATDEKVKIMVTIPSNGWGGLNLVTIPSNGWGGLSLLTIPSNCWKYLNSNDDNL